MPCTPVDSFIGGLLLFSAVFSLMKISGQILGFSGIISTAVTPWSYLFPLSKSDFLYYMRRIVFVAGHGVGALLLAQSWPRAFSFTTMYQDMRVYVVLGAIMGVSSAKLSTGCTSGHMIVGLSRFSPRSLVATLLFFVVAIPVSMWSSQHIIRPRNPAEPFFEYPSETELLIMLGCLAAAALIFTCIAILGHFLRSLGSFQVEVLTLINNFCCGFFAALGLGFAGMTNPMKVLGFLNLTSGNWDPSLMFIVLGCLVPLSISYHLFVKPTGASILDPSTKLHQFKTKVDWKLLVGSPLFGLVWGLTGFCPGTVFTVLPTMFAPVTSFVAGMLVGFVGGEIFESLSEKFSSQKQKSS